MVTEEKVNMPGCFSMLSRFSLWSIIHLVVITTLRVLRNTSLPLQEIRGAKLWKFVYKPVAWLVA